jgi:hypothetical protein
MMNEEELRKSLEKACSWITDVAQVKDEAVLPGESRTHGHRRWTGAIRGEYRVSDRRWGYFCPVWHTGQAVKALVMASDVLGDGLLAAAKAGADFIVGNAIRDGEDAGLVLAYEDDPERINTSAILECLDGLFMLSEKTGTAQYRETAAAFIRVMPIGGAAPCWSCSRRLKIRSISMPSSAASTGMSRPCAATAGFSGARSATSRQTPSAMRHRASPVRR